MKVTVLGSCVSRVSLLNGNQEEHGIHGGKELGIELEYFLDKHNMALALMDPPFSKEQVATITEETFWDKTRVRSLKQSLMKETIPMLLESKSEYLVMDLYDFHTNFLTYGDTGFSTQANEFMGTKLCQSVKSQLKSYCFFDLPTWTYYPLVDMFFEKIMTKFDKDHIILNRFRANTYFWTKNGQIAIIPDQFKQPFQCHDKYNEKCRALEEHIIQKFDVRVIDISKYYMGDHNAWENLNASHFEKQFYEETYQQLIRIFQGKAQERYYDQAPFLELDAPVQKLDRELDIDFVIEVMQTFMEKNDILWTNLLDKLYRYAPDDPRVAELIKAYQEAYF